jgi:integrase
VSEKNDIYSREKRLETLLEKIRENRGSENADNLLGYGKYMLLNGIGVERREKVIRTLYLVSQWQEKPFVQMERADLEDIVERIERSKESEWTKHDYEVIIKKFFKWLRKTEEYPPEAKWIKPKNVKNGKLPEDLLTKEEVSRMIDCAQNPRDKAMIAVLYESGCRVGELCNLNIKDITFDEYGCVVLFPRGKTGPRRVRLAFSTPFLATWIDNHPLKDPDSWLWVNLGQTNRNEAMSYAGVNKMLRSVAKKAGVKKSVNPHNFRHSRATRLASSFTEAQLCEYLGWAQGSSVPQVYVHMSGRDLDSAVLKMNGIKTEEEKEEEDPLKPVKCPRCGTISVGNFCTRCGAVLNAKTAVELQERNASVDKQLASLLRDGEVRTFLIEKLKKIL